MKESTIPVNSMGASSSVPSTGAIDLYDPILSRAKILKRAQNIIKKMKKRTKKKRKLK